ncbi:hypothetical protein M8C21_017222, partial [Ambrosia artemisiifolia]
LTYISFNSLGSYSYTYPSPTTTTTTILSTTPTSISTLKVDENEFTDVYHTPEVFRLNYAEMEKRFKVYIYPDGDPKTFYQTPRKLTGKESRFRTEDPDEAHLFFIPISCHKMRGKVDLKDISYDVGFIPHKDIALPQVLQPFALPRGGNDIENRTTLGFWAGHRNSRIRVILARTWENDTELDISNNRINRATGHLVYQKRFYRTKFCICPGGSQVNSARIADSIHYGCIPVILSNYYDLPFNDILDWSKFSVVLKEKDVYDLKQILKDISNEQFVTLHNNLVQIQKHFQWNTPPIPYDAFHMVMYDLWLRHSVIKY